MCHFFWTPWFLMRNLLSFELLFPFRYCVISLWLLSRFFSLFFIFRSLIMWLIVDFFGFILFRVHLASCICRFMSIPKFRKFRGIIFSNIFPSYTFFLSFWDSSDTNIRAFVVPLCSETVHFFSVSFLCFVQFLFILSSVSVFVISILLLSSSELFSFSVIVILVLKVPFGSFWYLVFLCWDFLFFPLFQMSIIDY